MDVNLIIPDKRRSLLQGAILPLGEQPRGNWYAAILKSLAKHYEFKFTQPWSAISKEAQDAIIHGTGGKKIKMAYESDRWKGEYEGAFEGVIPNMERRYKQTTSPGVRKWIEGFMSSLPCESCGGSRLRIEANHVLIGRKSITARDSAPAASILVSLVIVVPPLENMNVAQKP